MYAADGSYIGRILILGIERDRVKLGFDVDPRFLLLRDELVQQPAVPEASPSAATSAGLASASSRPSLGDSQT